MFAALVSPVDAGKRRRSLSASSRISQPLQHRAQWLTGWLGAALLVWAAAAANGAPGVKERPPAVAGSFYPAETAQLSKAVEQYLHQARPARTPRPIALLAPHAGLVFSGQIAADAYRQAAAHSYDVIVILGVNHTVPPFQGGALPTTEAFRTPLGLVAVEKELASRLAGSDRGFFYSDEPHRREHSVEIQIPFLQTVFPGVPILPVVVGEADPASTSKLGQALAQALQERRPLLIASSDLSHYPDYEDAKQLDRETLELVQTMGISEIHYGLHSLSRPVNELATRACGEASILTAIAAAKVLGADAAEVISYANSGDTLLGDRDRVVGYGAVVFFSRKDAVASGRVIPQDSDSGPSDPVLPADGEAVSRKAQQRLLMIARESIVQYLQTRTAPLWRETSGELSRKSGVFVTLRKKGTLRGCVGRMLADLPLAQAVGHCALQAAFNDNRFSPLTAGELPAIEIEISVLSEARPVQGAEDIQAGRDGVVLLKQGHSATFLPQVAGEQGWNKEEMLDQLCLKAGLPGGCWRTGAKFRTYQAFVFSDSSLSSEKAK